MHKSIKITLGILAVLIIAVVGVNYYAKLQLKKALEDLQEKNELTYDRVNVNVLLGKASISKITFDNASLSVEAKKASATGFSYWDYLFSESLEFNTVTLSGPKIILKPKPDKSKDTAKKKPKPLDKIIIVKSFSLDNGYLDIFKAEDQKTVSTHIVDFKMTGIKTSDSLMSKPLPFSYDSVSASMDSIYLRVNQYEDLKLKRLEIVNNNVTIDNLQMVPKYNRAEFQTVIPYEKDIITLDVPEMTVANFKIINHNDALLFKTPQVNLKSPKANIYRDKNAPDDTRIKPMYSEMLRDLDFGLIVESLNINDANLVYEEKAEGKDEPGKVIFERLNAEVANVSNTTLYEEKLPITTLDISTGFMDNATLDVFWQFNINNPADYFMIKGVGRNVTSKDINYFFVPAVNVKAIGTLDKIDFNYAGNVDKANGDMTIIYDKFKVEVLREDGKKKNRFLSAIANLFLDNNEKNGIVKKNDIEAVRNKTRSFWNYFWLCIRNGALQSLTSKS